MQCIHLYFSVFLFITATAYAGTWNTFRGNPQLTGVAATALPDNLHLLWTYTTQDAIESTAAIHENTVYVGSLDGQLYALNLITGSLKWQYQADGEIKSSPTVDDSTVYFGDEHGTFHAVDRATGEVVWEADMTGGSVLGGVIGTSAYAEGTLYVGSNAGGEGNMPTGETEVLALDADTGEIRWSTTLPGAIYAPITVVPDLVLAATTEGQMVALDAGSVYWGYGFALSLGSESAGLGGLMAFTPSGAPAGGTAPGGEAASGVGADVYRKSCASCHGTKGQGGIGPSLVGVADRLSEDEHLDTVRNGRDGAQMQGFEGTLTDDEIAAVVAHERTALTGS